MRMCPRVCLALTMSMVPACARNGDGSSTFSGGPGPGTVDPPDSSTGASDTSTGTSSTGAAASGEDSSPGTAAASTGVFDAGAQPDFEASPVGCNGKIDFLFMISRHYNMKPYQDRLVAAFPQFIATIEAKFADFDYHIMVVDGDADWDLPVCTDNCPTLTCKIGDACCDWYDPDKEGEPCCSISDYPCDSLDLETPCDRDWGAGAVFPVGGSASNTPCPIDGGRRYLVKGQTDLPGTFACIATVGISGRDMLGQALTAAVQEPINDHGGCNQYFLRDDALLMVTFISFTWDEGGGGLNSEGTPSDWAQAVLDAKHGDPQSIVMFNIGTPPECESNNGLCLMTEMFPLRHQETIYADDYGPAFAEAASLVETACEAFVPPPG
jgi:hypothetical protein